MIRMSQTSAGSSADLASFNGAYDRPWIDRCPICDSRRLHYAFSFQGCRVVRCDDCTLMMLNPQPGLTELKQIYTDDYFLGDHTPEGYEQVARMKRATARRYLRDIGRYRGGHGGRLIEIGCGRGDFLVEAQSLGYDVIGVEVSPTAAKQTAQKVGAGRVICGEIDSLAFGEAQFDVCVLADVIEHVREPVVFLKAVHRLLKPGGMVFIATPTLSSWSARLLRENWMEFKSEHLFYFDNNTIQHALHRVGFRCIVVQPGWKILSLDYVARHFERFRVPAVTQLVQLIARLAPKPLRSANVPVVASGMIVCAQTVALSARPRLSVIVPVYNEAATFEVLMEALLKKTLPGLDIEIIVVESNSTDGTRDIVLRYQDHPRVRVVLQDCPRGKGYAVRAGFEHATGDFILIQDADLEYDLEDYDALLEPLVQGRAAFVLGSRHGGVAWKMRHFEDNRLLGVTLNAGHWFFATLVNLLYGLRLKDPFTMYKVFRRDCLAGLTFECNRFDFDYELLIKLVRKGYRLIEIPVNYRSRSFSEGKKVSIWRDPLTWLYALVRLRFVKIDPMGVVAHQRR